MTMVPEIKEEWATTLEGDRFTQAHGQFKGLEPDGSLAGNVVWEHCCLAVLTEIAIEKGCEGIRWDPTDRTIPLVLIEDEMDIHPDDVIDVAGQRWRRAMHGNLPRPVAVWAGLVSEGGVPAEDPMLDGESAIIRNDDLSQSFREIAAAIRADDNL